SGLGVFLCVHVARGPAPGPVEGRGRHGHRPNVCDRIPRRSLPPGRGRCSRRARGLRRIPRSVLRRSGFHRVGLHGRTWTQPCSRAFSSVTPCSAQKGRAHRKALAERRDRKCRVYPFNYSGLASESVPAFLASLPAEPSLLDRSGLGWYSVSRPCELPKPSSISDSSVSRAL